MGKRKLCSHIPRRGRVCSTARHDAIADDHGSKESSLQRRDGSSYGMYVLDVNCHTRHEGVARTHAPSAIHRARRHGAIATSHVYAAVVPMAWRIGGLHPAEGICVQSKDGAAPIYTSCVAYVGQHSQCISVDNAEPGRKEGISELTCLDGNGVLSSWKPFGAPVSSGSVPSSCFEPKLCREKLPKVIEQTCSMKKTGKVPVPSDSKLRYRLCTVEGSLNESGR